MHEVFVKTSPGRPNFAPLKSLSTSLTSWFYSKTLVLIQFHLYPQSCFPAAAGSCFQQKAIISLLYTKSSPPKANSTWSKNLLGEEDGNHHLKTKVFFLISCFLVSQTTFDFGLTHTINMKHTILKRILWCFFKKVAVVFFLAMWSYTFLS